MQERFQNDKVPQQTFWCPADWNFSVSA